MDPYICQTYLLVFPSAIMILCARSLGLTESLSNYVWRRLIFLLNPLSYLRVSLGFYSFTNTVDVSKRSKLCHQNVREPFRPQEHQQESSCCCQLRKMLQQPGNSFLMLHLDLTEGVEEPVGACSIPLLPWISFLLFISDSAFKADVGMCMFTFCTD